MNEILEYTLEETLMELGKRGMTLVYEDKKWAVVAWDDLRSLYRWLYNDEWETWPEAASAALNQHVKERV